MPTDQTPPPLTSPSASASSSPTPSSASFAVEFSRTLKRALAAVDMPSLRTEGEAAVKAVLAAGVLPADLMLSAIPPSSPAAEGIAQAQGATKALLALAAQRKARSAVTEWLARLAATAAQVAWEAGLATAQGWVQEQLRVKA
jgi:hypothetical protein